MAVVALAGAHCGVKDDEVVAHYARADEVSPDVIRLDRLVESVGAAPPRPCILRTQTELRRVSRYLLALSMSVTGGHAPACATAVTSNP